MLHAVIATVAYGFALDAGETTSVAAITFTLETVAPSLVGLALLGDGVRPNTQVLAVAGFVLTLGACIALADRGACLIGVSVGREPRIVLRGAREIAEAGGTVVAGAGVDGTEYDHGFTLPDEGPPCRRRRVAVPAVSWA